MSNLGQIAIARDRFHGNEDHTSQIDFFCTQGDKMQLFPSLHKYWTNFCILVQSNDKGRMLGANVGGTMRAECLQPHSLLKRKL